MVTLAQQARIADVLARFIETIGLAHVFGAFVVLVLTGWILFFRRVDVAVLMTLALSVSTGFADPAVAQAAYIGRWFFLALAAVLGMTRLTKAYTPIVALALIWACGNIASIPYSASYEEGIVRGSFFILVVPAFMLSLGAPHENLDSLLRLMRWIALCGVLLACVHVIFMVAAPPGQGVGRFAGAFQSSQSMSISTATVTLPMIWALLTKNAGKWAPFVFVGVLVNLSAMLASAQRTGLFSLGGAILVLLCFYRFRGLVTAILASGAIGFLLWPIVTYLTSPAVLAQRFSSVESQDRVRMWFHFFEEAMKSPVWGHGSGSATAAGAEVYGLSFHNAYLATLYDLGFIGIGCFAALMAAGMLASLRLSVSKTPQRRALGAFLLASLCQVAVQGISEVGLANTANHTAMLFYFSLGVAAAASKMIPGRVELCPPREGDAANALPRRRRLVMQNSIYK